MYLWDFVDFRYPTPKEIVIYAHVLRALSKRSLLKRRASSTARKRVTVSSFRQKWEVTKSEHEAVIVDNLGS
jgi:hypothetical protein